MYKEVINNMMYKELKALDLTAVILLIIGGLNWGLVGIAEFDLVATIFGYLSVISKIVYTLVGISALYVIFILFRQRTV